MKIRTRLISILLGTSLLAVILGGIVNYLYAESFITTNILDHLDSVATVQKKRVNDNLDMNFERLDQTVASVRIILDHYSKNHDPNDKVIMQQLLFGMKNSVKGFEALFIMANDGTVIVSTDDSYLDKNYASDDLLKSGKQGNYLSIFKDPTGKVFFRMSSPIIYDNSLLGVMAVNTRADLVTDLTGDYTGLGQTGESFLAKQDSSGNATIINPLRFSPDSQLNMTIPANNIDKPVIHAVLGQQSQFTDLTDYRNHSVLAATRYIDLTHWGLVVKMDKAEAFAPLGKLAEQTTITILAISAVAMISSVFFSRTISNPIIDLKNACKKLANGELVQIKVRDKDEIGDLSDSFNQMSRSLSEAREKIEQDNKMITKQLEDLQSADREKKLMQNVERAKNEFLAMITHELKTPLVPIKSYVDLLLLEKFGTINNEQRKKLEIIGNSADSLLRLILDLVDVQKMGLGLLHLKKERHELSSIINEIISNMKVHLDSHHISIISDLQENIFCLCDKLRIGQVLTNLILNAIAFGPKENGKIQITLKVEGNYAKIIVKDNGAGIIKDNLDKIFVKFYQVDASSTRQHGGVGLGLSICKGIVERHGGKIWAESEGTGKGTEIHIMMPLEQ